MAPAHAFNEAGCGAHNLGVAQTSLQDAPDADALSLHPVGIGMADQQSDQAAVQ